jgi:hypothetical protein
MIIQGNVPFGKNYKQYILSSDELQEFKANVFEQETIISMDKCLGNIATLMIRKTPKKTGVGFWYNVDRCTQNLEQVRSDAVMEQVRPHPQAGQVEYDQRKRDGMAHLMKPASPKNQKVAETNMQRDTATINSIAMSEPVYRTKIQQTAKGHHYCEVTVKSNDFADHELRLCEAWNQAEAMCDRLNDDSDKELLTLQQEEDIIEAEDKHTEKVMEIVKEGGGTQ